MSARLPAVSVLLLSLLVGAPAPAADDASARAWTSRLAGSPAEASGGAPADLALVRASYELDVLGAVAVGVLVQEFRNTGEADLLVSYSAKAPSGLRVDALEMEVDAEVRELPLRAPVAEKKNRGGSQPRGSTEQAKAEPVLLEAGGTAIVRSGFQQTLSLKDGRFQVRLPAVAGGSSDPDVPGVTGAITVAVYHEEPLLFAESATHDIFVAFEGERSVIELTEGEIPSREFELELALGVEDDASLLGYAGPESEEGVRDLVVVFTPPMEPRDESVRPKQVLFVLDTSGSMAKTKIEQARQALSSCLDRMTPADLLNVIRFDSGFEMWNEEPLEASQANLDDARAWLVRAMAGGGTQMLPALGATMEQPEASEHHRMIIILTDGALQDTEKVLALLDSELGDGRLFVVGIGADVKEETILQLAEYGRGTAAFAQDPETLDAALSTLFESVSQPLAWDLHLDVGSAEVVSLQPRKIPDLYAGRPVTLHAKVRGELPDSVSIGASTTGGERMFTTRLPEAGEDGPRRLPQPARRSDPAEKKPGKGGRARR